MMETGIRPKIPVSGTYKSFQIFEVCHANDLKRYGKCQNKLSGSVSNSAVKMLHKGQHRRCPCLLYAIRIFL